MPECETVNSTSDVPSWWPVGTDTKCFKPVLDRDNYNSKEPCSNLSFLLEVEECHEWIYESENSIVAGVSVNSFVVMVNNMIIFVLRIE